MSFFSGMCIGIRSPLRQGEGQGEHRDVASIIQTLSEHLILYNNCKKSFLSLYHILIIKAPQMIKNPTDYTSILPLQKT